MAPTGESLEPQFTRNFGEFGGKSKLEDQRLAETLMMYHHAKNLPIPSTDQKEAFVLFLGTHGQTASNIVN